MIQTMAKNWWLLALCGVLEAAVAVLFFIMQQQNGVTFHAWNSKIVLVGKLTLAAGACTIAAGLWRSAKGKCWLLVLNGVGLTALGVIYGNLVGAGFRISFRTIALLIVLTAMSVGILELFTGRTLRLQGDVANAWFLSLAGVALFGFALAFLALGFRWIRIEHGLYLDLLLLGLYFGFSAVGLLGLALRLHASASSYSGPSVGPLLGTPRHAQ